MAEARAAALGWKSELAIANGKVSYRLIDKAGNAVARSAQRQISDGPHMPRKIRKWRWSASLTACCPHPPSCAMVSGVEIQTEIDADRPYRETRRLTLRNEVIQ
jgi:hypothetical protein